MPFALLAPGWGGPRPRAAFYCHPSHQVLLAGTHRRLSLVTLLAAVACVSGYATEDNVLVLTEFVSNSLPSRARARGPARAKQPLTSPRHPPPLFFAVPTLTLP